MGQKIGKGPNDRREDLSAERWRVLAESARVVTRMDERVNAEESFLRGYDEPRIAAKIEWWLDTERSKITDPHVAPGPDCPVVLEKAFMELASAVSYKTRRDYEAAYGGRWAKRAEEVAERQRRVHRKLVELEDSGAAGKELARLRAKVAGNARACGRIEARDRRRRREFAEKVCDIDQGNMELCRRKVRQIVEEFRRNWEY
ncbi:uncharacterized protein LOC106643841 [Copidosoma floridanum]|uniref:uncharacterized protein LOC106643841 n=1 Tax=Copidosoma floridanum TaxID=29053 RepID=UPI0006C9B05D|nr:uncharacterized protein LOC106643841 [Copidosoma floridanum]